MRVSKDPDHPDYSEYAGCCQYFLEGAERSNVETADEEGRFAVTWRLDEFGSIVRGKDGGILTDRFYGHVRIAAPEWLRSSIENQQRALKAAAEK